MAQLFKRRANALANLTLVGVPLLIVGTAVTLFAFARSDFWTRVDDPLEQPLPLSHKHHVGDVWIGEFRAAGQRSREHELPSVAAPAYPRYGSR